ncbi:hypothetical protein NEHOM01_1915 [Nematocida homosporus]|uniref:uncharacterized protein n=1 Tax=Nematocida homosporus TaxID=1912981 RepID=UPI00221F451D|nr:uncharacterized protein NEHOM01_1915 [Nematocida homosporus]KAI5187082.1 hypothetical protein NEHOM01_1915 [Nematocida homosporus]
MSGISIRLVFGWFCCVLVELSVVLTSTNNNIAQSNYIQSSFKLMAALKEFGLVNETSNYTLIEEGDESNIKTRTKWTLNFAAANGSHLGNTLNPCTVGLMVSSDITLLTETNTGFEERIQDESPARIVIDKDFIEFSGRATDKESRPAKALLLLLQAKNPLEIRIEWIDNSNLSTSYSQCSACFNSARTISLVETYTLKFHTIIQDDLSLWMTLAEKIRQEWGVEVLGLNECLWKEKEDTTKLRRGLKRKLAQ